MTSGPAVSRILLLQYRAGPSASHLLLNYLLCFPSGDPECFCRIQGCSSLLIPIFRAKEMDDGRNPGTLTAVPRQTLFIASAEHTKHVLSVLAKQNDPSKTLL